MSGRAGNVRGGRGAALLSGFLMLLAVSGSRAAEEENGALGLFQMIARAELVVRVRVKEGSLKYAFVDVLDSIKGVAPLPRLRIAFRDFNWHRRPGVDPIVFVNGTEEILFLTPASEAGSKPKNRDLFELFRGAEGRTTLPAEGAASTVANLKRLAVLTSVDPTAQMEGLWGLVSDADPRLQETALDELLRLRAPAESRLGALQEVLRSPSPGLRDRALRMIGDAFAAGVGGGRPEAAVDDLRSTLDSVQERARNDSDEPVRVTAVRALALWPRRSDVEPELRAIAATDPAQSVRYEAQRALITPRSR